MNKLYDRSGFCVFGASKPATSFLTRDCRQQDIMPYGRADEYGLTEAQYRHLDPKDDFSVYDDMDVTITLNAGTDRERQQLITVPAPAKQWRYWHRRMNGGS